MPGIARGLSPSLRFSHCSPQSKGKVEKLSGSVDDNPRCDDSTLPSQARPCVSRHLWGTFLLFNLIFSGIVILYFGGAGSLSPFSAVRYGRDKSGSTNDPFGWLSLGSPVTKLCLDPDLTGWGEEFQVTRFPFHDLKPFWQNCHCDPTRF